jgi:hypothetical protein
VIDSLDRIRSQIGPGARKVGKSVPPSPQAPSPARVGTAEGKRSFAPCRGSGEAVTHGSPCESLGAGRVCELSHPRLSRTKAPRTFYASFRRRGSSTDLLRSGPLSSRLVGLVLTSSLVSCGPRSTSSRAGIHRLRPAPIVCRGHTLAHLGLRRPASSHIGPSRLASSRVGRPRHTLVCVGLRQRKSACVSPSRLGSAHVI